MTHHNPDNLFVAASTFAELLATPNRQVDAMHSYAVEVPESPRTDVQTVWMLWSDENKRFLRIGDGRIVVDAKHHGLSFHSLQAALQFMPALVAELKLVPVQVAVAGHHIYTQIGINTANASPNGNFDRPQMVPIILMQLTGNDAYWQSMLPDVPPVPLLFADKQSANDIIGMLSRYKADVPRRQVASTRLTGEVVTDGLTYRHHVVGIPRLVNPTRLVGAVICAGTYKTLTYFRRAALPVTKTETSQRVVLLN